MKVLLDKYPKGSLPRQKSDGRYVDGYLHDNLSVMAKNITRDMTFMGIIFSSTLEVGTGKSVLATQIGEIWTEMVNKEHGTDLKFDMNNVVFNPKDLIERSFQVPKYSCILLDEWEDSTYWSQLGITLRQFFRKCRQLNLFMIVIIPNFFQMTLNYAVSRSVFAIDVKFEGEFQRGFFDFYSFDGKKNLYIKGKKFHNYNVQRANFHGRFGDGYGVDRAEYLKLKRADAEKQDLDDIKKQPAQIISKVRMDAMEVMVNEFPEFKTKDVAKVFGVARQTVHRLLTQKKTEDMQTVARSSPAVTTYNNVLTNKKNKEEEPSPEQSD